MKKTFNTVLLSLGILLGAVAIGYAVSPGDTFIVQRDPTNTFNQTTLIPLPAGPAVLTLDTATNLPLYSTFGSGISFNPTAKTLSVAAVPESSITNLASDLSAKFNTPTGTTSQVILGDGTLGSLPGGAIAYEGTTQRTNAFPIFKSATVSSGTAVLNLTADGTSGGTALCTNGVIQDSVGLTVNDATASYQMAYAFSNSNKTLTVTTNKLTTANILTGILGQSAANGSVVKLTVWCY